MMETHVMDVSLRTVTWLPWELPFCFVFSRMPKSEVEIKGFLAELGRHQSENLPTGYIHIRKERSYLHS